MNRDGAGITLVALGAWLVYAAAASATEPVAGSSSTHSDATASAHEALHEEHGRGLHYLLLGDRFEFRSDEREDSLVWDLEGWYGGDLQRIRIKTEGSEPVGSGDSAKDLEVQALYSRAVSTYFDLEVGLRYDIEPGPSRAHAVLGLQGLAPYWFEIDTALFVSDDGDLSARLEIENDLFLTQRLILQPRAELELSAGDVPEVGVGSGLSSTSLGLRLRYEIRRELAPYLGLEWSYLNGRTADLARAVGEPASSSAIVAGLRFWY